MPKHFLPTALTTSLISIFLEVYVLSRLAVLLTRQATLTSPPRTLRDSRIGKALSLLFLELLTIGPSAVHITLLADFIPVSIGALFVLGEIYFVTYGLPNTDFYLVAFNCFRSSPIEDVPSLDRTTAPPISVPGIVRRSDWFRSSSGSSQNRDNGEVEAYPSSPPVPGSFPHPFSAQYQGEISRFSTTETTMSHEPVIQTAQRSAPPRTARAIVVTPSDMQSFPTASTQGVTEFTSVTVIPPPSPAVEVQVSSPEPSLAVTPTSLLMHPWHEGPRSMNGAEGYDRKSFTSTIRAADRLSYTYQGFAFPVPPIPSPTNATRRYSSSTLASPMFSQEGDEDGERKKTVKLLTFASTFRSSGGGTGVL
ncbi:hypothetical protein C0991_003997 [Blastosporella zonata]|nr:hypothetical protein C0991_003997 [Blastosporella zonata]